MGEKRIICTKCEKVISIKTSFMPGETVIYTLCDECKAKSKAKEREIRLGTAKL